MKKPMIRCTLAALGVLAVLSCLQCERFVRKRYPLTLKNNAPHPIRYYLSLDYPADAPVYPDTTLPDDRNLYQRKVNPGEEFDMYEYFATWDKLIADLPGDTLSIFIFHVDTLAKYPWEQVRRQYKILKRYDLGAEDARRLGSRITYPPDASMKGVKMYPK